MGNSSNRIFCTASILAMAVAVQGQVLLSDFTSGVDGWSGNTGSNTPYAAGSTAASTVNYNGNQVLNVSDAGYTGGASRSYTGLVPENGVVTVVADMRIVHEVNVGADASFGIKRGTAPGVAGDFAYSVSPGTAGDDDNQEFRQVAASIYVGGDTADVTAAITPSKSTWSVSGANAWAMQLDNIKQATGGTLITLDTFNTSILGWSKNTASNSPFPDGSTGLTHVTDAGNGVLNITDAAWTGGAVGVYPAAVSSPGVHTVLADVRIVSEDFNLTGARLAAAPGTVTNVGDLAWSASFATPADDDNQDFQTIAVPVTTDGPSDLALYVFPSFSGQGGSSGWTIQVDNVRLVTDQAVPVNLSEFAVE